jgi:repressor of nif and glnA expression
MDASTDLEIQKQILQVLYDCRQNGFMQSKRIHQQLPEYIQELLSRKQIDFHLRTLKERKLIREKKETHKSVPIFKSTLTRSVQASTTSFKYEISDLGVSFVESGFKIEKSQGNHKSTAIFIGSNFNFGVINNTINYNIELNNLIDDQKLREVIESYFDQIKSELSKEKINKNRIVELLKNIGAKVSDKGLDKVMDLAYTYIGSFFKQFL